MGRDTFQWIMCRQMVELTQLLPFLTLVKTQITQILWALLHKNVSPWRRGLELGGCRGAKTGAELKCRNDWSLHWPQPFLLQVLPWLQDWVLRGQGLCGQRLHRRGLGPHRAAPALPDLAGTGECQQEPVLAPLKHPPAAFWVLWCCFCPSLLHQRQQSWGRVLWINRCLDVRPFMGSNGVEGKLLKNHSSAFAVCCELLLS